MIQLSVKSIKLDVRTRMQRRTALTSVVKQLSMIRDAEIKSLENRPASFWHLRDHRTGVAAVESIECAIDYLGHCYKEDKSIIDYIDSGNVYF